MRAFAIGVVLSLGCAHAAFGAGGAVPSQYGALVAKHAQANGVPEALIHRVIMRESRYNPRARNGPYYGMMQISMATARGAGYRGSPAGLLDADTNLTYAVRYLAGAYKVAGGNHGRAVGYYARGYYYAAKGKGMLAAIGMGRDGKLTPPKTAPATDVAAQPPGAPQIALAAASPAPAPAPQVVPVPPARGALPQPSGARTIDPNAAAPVLAAVVPTPQPRDPGPAVTGSVAPRAVLPPQRPAPPANAAQGQVAVAAAPLPTARDAARPVPTPQPRVLPVGAPPALAAATPVPTARPAASPLAYAGAPRPASEAAPAQLRTAPLPPRR